jgi:hypothetical protein
MSYLVDVLSARFVPQVWRTELMNQLSTHVILDPIGCLDSATDNRLSFGGQRSIQLSYGRLWASIDQTPASGNVLDIAGFCSIGLCVKAPAAKFGRSNRLGRASRSCAEGVPGRKSRRGVNVAHS